MDGRDIGTVVRPWAQVKIYLTASPEERARRRCEEMRAKGEQADFDQILADMIERDYQDSHRAVAPLRPAEDAVLLDSTGLTLAEVVDRIVAVSYTHLGRRSRPKDAIRSADAAGCFRSPPGAPAIPPFGGAGRGLYGSAEAGGAGSPGVS